MLYRMYRYIQKIHLTKNIERNKTKAAFKYQSINAELWFQDVGERLECLIHMACSLVLTYRNRNSQTLHLLKC